MRVEVRYRRLSSKIPLLYPEVKQLLFLPLHLEMNLKDRVIRERQSRMLGQMLMRLLQ
jgi:hypothetical protein